MWCVSNQEVHEQLSLLNNNIEMNKKYNKLFVEFHLKF